VGPSITRSLRQTVSRIGSAIACGDCRPSVVEA
jgi:hypothetical protein